MACVEMYNQNSEHKGFGGAPPMSPRISFSNDFVESSSSSSIHSHHMRNNNHNYSAPVSSDFEFSVSNYSMMSADELFSKGRLLPFKETFSSSSSSSNHFHKTTLRDELQNGDDDANDFDFTLRPPKSSTRWKGFLGLRKSHIGSRKSDKTEDKRPTFVHGDIQSTKNSQESGE